MKLDPGAQPVEHEPLDQTGLLRRGAVDEVALADIEDKEVEQNLALRLEKGGVSGFARCERRSCLQVDKLIEQYGDMELPELRLILAGDCPKAAAKSRWARSSSR